MENIILQTRGITVKYGGFSALDNVSISLKERHIYEQIWFWIIVGILIAVSGALDVVYALLEKKK